MVALVVSTRYRPHELALLSISVVIGGSYLLGLIRATSVVALAHPAWTAYVWALSMIVSGVCGLLGNLAWRHMQLRALYFQAFGMELGAIAVTYYTITLIAYAGWRAAAVTIIFVAWAAANVWRGRTVRREIRQLRETPG